MALCYASSVTLWWVTQTYPCIEHSTLDEEIERDPLNTKFWLRPWTMRVRASEGILFTFFIFIHLRVYYLGVVVCRNVAELEAQLERERSRREKLEAKLDQYKLDNAYLMSQLQQHSEPVSHPDHSHIVYRVTMTSLLSTVNVQCCHAHFFFRYNFMLGLCNPKLCTKFEVASFSHCRNIKGEPSNMLRTS